MNTPTPHDGHDLVSLPPEAWAAYEALQGWFEIRRERYSTLIHDEARRRVEAALLGMKPPCPKPERVPGWARKAMYWELIKVRRRLAPVTPCSDSFSFSLSLSLSAYVGFPRREWGPGPWRKVGWVYLYSIREPFSRKLSPREKRVLSAILDRDCLSQSEVATALGIPLCDVANYLSRIGKKLGRFCQPRVS